MQQVLHLICSRRKLVIFNSKENVEKSFRACRNTTIQVRGKLDCPPRLRYFISPIYHPSFHSRSVVVNTRPYNETNHPHEKENKESNTDKLTRKET